MQYQFTSGAERVVSFAAGYISHYDYTRLAGQAVLLGLLKESECRPGLLLARHGITTESLCKKWPKLTRTIPNSSIQPHLSSDFLRQFDKPLREVSEMVEEFVRPPILETEHLLLCLLMQENELAAWLEEHGLERRTLREEIIQRY
ncbi:MAG: Clp protease N-terminal domain-containing protein, partial [Thermoguttaceae bacterium]